MSWLESSRQGPWDFKWSTGRLLYDRLQLSLLAGGHSPTGRRLSCNGENHAAWACGKMPKYA